MASQHNGGFDKLQEVEDPPADAQPLPPPYSHSVPNYGTGEAAPPSYEQTASPGDAPPSYDSLYGKVKAAKQDSSGVLDFFRKFLVIVLGTIACSICVALLMAIPISMIVMGSMYIHKCPRERFIPIYLVVAGSVGIFKNLINLCQRVKNRKEDQDDQNARTNPLDSLLNCFLFAWFIAGNVWIYRTYNDFSTDPKDSNFCDPTLYWYAFWINTATYIIMGTVCFCICCAGLLAGVVTASTDDS